VTATAEQLELAAAATWSPDVSVYVDGWRVSSNGGFTRRLNSATAVGQAETSLVAKRSVTDWLSERGSPLVVRVTPLTDPSTAESCERNWFLAPRDETIVMTKPISENEMATDMVEVDPLDKVFVEDLFTLNQRGPDDDDSWSRMVSRAAPDATGLWSPGVAVGFVAVSGTLAFVYSVAVEATERRNGFGTEIMVAAESWAVKRGARSMTAQVLGTNAPALGLYEGLGYCEAYRYHYLEAVTH